MIVEEMSELAERKASKKLLQLASKSLISAIKMCCCAAWEKRQTDDGSRKGRRRKSLKKGFFLASKQQQQQTDSPVAIHFDYPDFRAALLFPFRCCFRNKSITHTHIHTHMKEQIIYDFREIGICVFMSTELRSLRTLSLLLLSDFCWFVISIMEFSNKFQWKLLK